MNVKDIESKFAAMGARLKVREISPQEAWWNRRWQRTGDYAMLRAGAFIGRGR